MAPTENVRNDEIAATFGDGLSRGSRPSSCVTRTRTAASGSLWMSRAAARAVFLTHADVDEHARQFPLLSLRVLLDFLALETPFPVDLLVLGLH